MIISENGCSDTSDCHFVSSVGIENSDIRENISIYPNPTNDFITLNLGDSYSDVQLKLYNAQGQLIRSWSFDSLESTKLDIPETKGMYTLSVVCEKLQTALRLVKN